MAKHSISEAARLTGKARSTLHRHLKEGKLSKGAGDDGQPVIDTAELVRVYGPLQALQDSKTAAVGQPATGQRDSRDRGLWDEVEALRRDKVERLEADLADARRERDEWKEQAHRLSGLLSDQREKGHEAAPSPAEQPSWKRFFRFW